MDTLATVATVESTHTIKSTELLTLPPLAILEVSPEIASNYIRIHNLLSLDGMLLGDYPKRKQAK